MKKVMGIYKITKEVVKEFDGICNALRYLGINPNYTQTITDCCKGKLKTAYNYCWEYKEIS